MFESGLFACKEEKFSEIISGNKWFCYCCNRHRNFAWNWSVRYRDKYYLCQPNFWFLCVHPSALFPISTYGTCLLTLAFYIVIVQLAHLHILFPLDYFCCFSTTHTFSLTCILTSSIKQEPCLCQGKGKHYCLLFQSSSFICGYVTNMTEETGTWAAEHFSLIRVLILLSSLFLNILNSLRKMKFWFSTPNYILFLLESQLSNFFF